MSCYLSLLDKEVFEGVTPPEGMPTSPVEEAKPHSMMTIPAIASKEQAAKETSQKLAKERKFPKFAGWDKSAAPIPACGGCWAAPLPIKKPGADLSAYGQLQSAYKDNAHRKPPPLCRN